ncbi:hypothetical protein HZI46_28045 [Serratia fonticola]|uniref:Uncharacterized protein n=1 Tax=Serratia fonticola TaxID=47917 RepID=A0AAW3WZ86_SERFO|nr:hypothetical protein [Serratia fonticola]NYA16350.1 hypothetical protein [Serratia fonticola]NYA36457.1 hypothetical protein [Serratia fonticola]
MEIEYGLQLAVGGRNGDVPSETAVRLASYAKFNHPHQGWQLNISPLSFIK